MRSTVKINLFLTKDLSKYNIAMFYGMISNVIRDAENMLKNLIVFIALLLFLVGLFFLRSKKTGGLSPESGMIIDALNSIGNGADSNGQAQTFFKDVN